MSEKTKTVIAAATLWWCWFCGTSQGDTTAQHSVDVGGLAAQHQLLRERTTTKFSHAAFLSPVHDSAAGRGVWMAPLLLQEIRPIEGSIPEFARFGAVITSAQDGHAIDESRLTVYTTARRIPIAGRLYRQDTYAWFYPSTQLGKPLHYLGFRQTLGRKGYPAVREVISSETTERVFFVSKSLEQAAAQQFGAALTGRRFSVEPGCSKHPDVLVARVLADGAQPMGPFVYLDSSLAMPTLKCRCEPSQIGEFTLNHHYRLVPLKTFEKLLAEGISAADVPLPANSAQLDGVLRLPSSM